MKANTNIIMILCQSFEVNCQDIFSLYVDIFLSIFILLLLTHFVKLIYCFNFSHIFMWVKAKKKFFILFYINTNNYGYIQIYNLITMYYLSNLSNFNYLQIPLSLARANENCRLNDFSTSKYLITRSKSIVSTWIHV
jgi:hypothetical protein